MTPQANHQLRVITFLTAVYLSLAALPSAAESPHWTPATPFGGGIVAIAEAPSAPGRLYAASQLGPLFTSRNGGGTWTELPVGNFLGNPLAGLVVDSHDPQTIFARTFAGRLLRSRDGGVDWLPVGEAELPQVTALAQDGRDPAIWYAATTTGLYRSLDGGTRWGLLAFDGSSLATLAIDPRDPDMLFALMLGHGIGDPAILWHSTDQGLTWHEALKVQPQGVDSLAVRLVFDSVHPGTLYTVFASDPPYIPLYRSTDGGTSWLPLLAGGGIVDLVVLPDGTLLGAADLGATRSTDGGDTWQPPLPASGNAATAPRDVIAQLSFAATDHGTVLAAGSEGIWKSGDGGRTWTESDRGISTLPVFSLIGVPTGPDTILAAAGDSVFRSIDQGTTWARVFSSFSGLVPYTLAAFDPFQPRQLYGVGFDGVADHLLKSNHRGSDWQNVSLPYGCGGDSICSVEIFTVAVDPRVRGRIYAGGSFFEHFGGSGFFLLRSDDDFRTYTTLAPPNVGNSLELGFTVMVDSANSEILHSLTCGGLMESRDGGSSWRETGRGLPAALCSNQAPSPTLAVDPEQPTVLYVGTLVQGVWRSGDGGRTFQPMSRGLPKVPIATIVIDPTDSARIYAAVVHRGVFTWMPSEQRWVPLNAGLPVASFNGVLTLDPQRPSLLFAGSDTQGVFRLDLTGSASPAP